MKKHSLYDQSESADLSEIQIERTHVKTNFCADNTNLFCTFMFFLINILFIIFFVFRSQNLSNKLCTIISRVPIFGSDQNLANMFHFSIDLKLSNVFHNIKTISQLNCTAIKTKPFFYIEKKIDRNRLTDFSHLEKYQNLLNSTDESQFNIESTDKSLIDFQISGKYRIFDKDSKFDDFSDLKPRKVSFEFSKDSQISRQFNFLNFYFNDPEHTKQINQTGQYAEYSIFYSPAISFQFSIQSSSTQFNALDFYYHYQNIFADEIFRTDLKLFSSFLFVTLVYNLMSNISVPFPTTFFCILMAISGIIPPLCNLIQCFTSDQIGSQKAGFPQILFSQEKGNNFFAIIELFSFSFFVNISRLFVNIQLYFLYRQSFNHLNRRPASLIFIWLITFYSLFSCVDFLCSYYINEQFYSSLNLISFTTIDIFIGNIRQIFLIVHFVIFIILIKYSYQTVFIEPDNFGNQESNRFITLIIFSFISNFASVYVTWFYNNPVNILPEILYYSSFYFSASSFLVLFSGVHEDDNADFKKFSSLKSNY